MKGDSIYRANHSIWIAVTLLLSGIFCILTLRFSGGFWFPDEIFQTMEPAFSIVTGKGVLSWEFTTKARGMLYPFLLSVWMRAVFLFSNEPATLYVASRAMLALFFLWAVGTIWFRFKRTMIDSDGFSASISPWIWNLVFSAVLVCFPLIYYFGFRTLTDSIAGTLTLVALFALPDSRARPRLLLHFLLGVLLGLSYGIRFQTGLFLAFWAPAYALQMWLSEKKILSAFALGFGIFVSLALYAVSDYVYYGIPFISSINYFKATVIDEVGNKYGTSPFGFYFQMYDRYLGFMLIFLIPGSIKLRRWWPVLFAVSAFVLVHACIAHKDLRYLFFTFPILLYCIAVGILASYQFIRIRWSDRWAMAFLSIVLLGVVAHQTQLLRKKIPWNMGEEVMQAHFQAHKAGIHGNLLIGYTEVFATSGGFVYLGREFKGNLFFFNLQNQSRSEIRRILDESKIDFALLHETQIAWHCANIGLCEPVWRAGGYVWVKGPARLK
ncbi:MAG: hypothetical protein K8S54_13045 [Spirochaetia bacterium]|nr:hypothetical protein [Spirochaetia bacterium]